MTSSRLPGKVLRKVLGKSLLEYQVERLRRVSNQPEIVIATTTNIADDPVEAVCDKLGLACFRGSEQDVLSRYHGAADLAKADIVVRVTSDCPLIDSRAVSAVLDLLGNGTKFDYVSNVMERTYPRGMDSEAFTFAALDTAHREAHKPAEREHVTPFILTQPSKFRLGSVKYHRDLSFHRWTVDTEEDFELIRNLLEDVYPRKPEFQMEDCLDSLGMHPDWFQINSHVEQKTH